MEDNLIIELYWTRSENAIAETSNKYGYICNKISYNILEDKQDSEECVNDSYLKLWNSIPEERPKNLMAYLGKIVRNLSLNKYRYKQAQKRNNGNVEILLDELNECVPSADNVEDDFDGIQLTNLLNNFVETLTDENMMVFIKRYWYCQSILEIALQYKMSTSKVKSMLMRTRNKLRDFLTKEGVING